jgi:hypothetical protein
MHATIQILLISLLLLFSSVVRAQTPVRCGIVDIDGPSEVEPGTPVVFKVKITGPIHTTKPEFNWKVSAGTIMTGQGTDEITVDTVGLSGVELIATAELYGAPAGCRASASGTTQVKVQPFICGLAFDRYGDLKFEDEKARLDNFAIQLMNSPLASGSILMSAGRETYRNEARERLDRIKSYLVDVREVEPYRIVTFDCGFAPELLIQLYIVPPGATLPACDNSIEVPLSEVKFTKPRRKSTKKKR